MDTTYSRVKDSDGNISRKRATIAVMDSPPGSGKGRTKSIDSATSVGSLSQDSESSGIGMEKDSWNSSSVSGGARSSFLTMGGGNKSFHAGISTNNRGAGGRALSSLTSAMAAADGVIRGSRVGFGGRGGDGASPGGRGDGAGAGDKSVVGPRCGGFVGRRGIANGVGGTIGMSSSLVNFGGAHHYAFRRPDWLNVMNGSTLTDASSLAFEDNDYQWCSEYASSLHSPGCGSASGSSTCFKPVGLLSLSTSGVVHDASLPQTPDDPPYRATIDAKSAVVDSMYGGDDDGTQLGAAVEFEVFPAEDIQGFMQFPEESGQSGVMGAGGETFASITQSLMAAQEWGLVDSDTRAIFQEGSEGASSFCGSTPLFSPTREDEDEVSNVSIGVFSVDSLDVNDASSKYQKPDGTVVAAREEDLDELDLELTWTTADIKTNYTLAFEGSYTTTTHEVSSPDDSQDGSRASTTGPSWTESIGKESLTKLTQSTSGTLPKTQYTWSQVKLLKANEAGGGSGGALDACVSPSGNLGLPPPPSMAVSVTAAGPTGAARSSSMPDLMRRSMLAAALIAKNHPTPLYDVSRSTGVRAAGYGGATVSSVASGPPRRRQISASLAQLFMKNRGVASTSSSSARHAVDPSSATTGDAAGHDNTLSVVSISEEEEAEDVLMVQNGSGASTNEEFCSAKSTLSSRSGARAPDIPTDPQPLGLGSSDSQSTAQNVSSDVLTEHSSSNKQSKCLQTSVSEATTTAAIETQFSEDSLKPGATATRHAMTAREKASILVCYPNYALPDLTFLGRSSRKYDANVYLCPQKASGSPDTSVVDASKLPKKVQRRAESAKSKSPPSASRPLSTDDILRIQESSFSHIKDWDSLQTLLPDGVKRLITKRKTSIAETPPPLPSFEPEIKFRKPRPRSCDPALFFRKSFIIEEAELESDQENRVSGGDDDDLSSSSRSRRQMQPKGILRKTYSSGEDRSAASDAPSTATVSGSPSVVRRRNAPCSPASRLLRNLRSKSAESQQKQAAAAAARRLKHRESYIYDDSKDPSSAGANAAAVDGEDDDSSATIANTVSNNSSCGCRTPVAVDAPGGDHYHHHCKRPDALELRSQVSEMISARSNLSTPTRHLYTRKRFHRSAGNLSDGKLSYSNQAEEYYSKTGGGDARKLTHCPCGGVLRHRKSVSFAELGDDDAQDGGGGGTIDGRDWCWDCGAYAADIPTLWSGGPGASSASLPTTPLKCARAALSPTLDFSHKQDLVENLASAVLELRRIVRQAIIGGKAEREEIVGGALPCASSTEKRISDWALDSLCPAIYAALSDGLLPQIQTLFGSVPNSLWKVVEVSSQLGSTTKALNDLVTKVNSEEHLNEGPLKFNAFICGLLNIQSLRSWLCYLRTRESVIQKHFHPHAFLYGANSWSRMLYDEMLSLLAPLSTQSFNLDLLYEYRRLHSSFQFMEEKMKHHLSADRLDSKTNLTDEGLRSERGETPDDRRGAMRKAHSQDYFLDSGVGTTQSDKPEADQHLRGMVRTRSSMDNTNTVTDFAAGVRKRWSGVQLGSKLLQALDQLALDDDDEDASSGTAGSEVPQIRDSSDGSDKNGNKRSQESVKFSRLRRKWEILSGNKKPLSPLPSKIPRPVHKVSPTSNTKAIVNPAVSSGSPGPSASVDSKKVDPPALPAKPAVMPKTFPVPLGNAGPVRPKSAPQKQSAMQGRRQETPETLQPPVMSPESEQSCFSPMDTSSSSARSSSSAGSGVQQTKQQQASRGGVFSRWMGSQQTPKQNVNKNWKPPLSIPPKPSHVTETHRANPSGTLGMASSPLRHRTRPAVPVDDNANGDNFSEMRRVRTICHHLGKENGHLSFNKDQEMTLVVAVDDRWLLCATGDQKGLVPRNAVVFAD